jgi:hypothetical protein
MNECTYYFKAEFLSEKEAQSAQKKITKFLAESRKAYEFYQKARAIFLRYRLDGFWQKFKSQYPLVFNYVQTLPEYIKDPESADLSGLLDFGQDSNDVYIKGAMVSYEDGMVWHFTDWGPLCNYIQKHFGAIKAVWDTEENGIGSLDSLQLYDYKEIVTNLLKHEELFPLLVGVHDELDAMLDIRMKHSKKGK